MFDSAIFDGDIFDTGQVACMFDEAVFDSAIFDTCIASGGKPGLKPFTFSLPSSDEDAEEAIALLLASDDL